MLLEKLRRLSDLIIDSWLPRNAGACAVTSSGQVRLLRGRTSLHSFNVFYDERK